MKTSYDNVAEEYIKYRNDLPDELLPGLETRGIVFNGAKIADFGAGPGFLSELLSAKGGIVDAVEASEDFHDHAKSRFRNDNRVNFNLKKVENSGLPAKTFDIVIALRSWHWFDRADAMEEVRRILKPDGHLIVADFGLVKDSGVARETMKVIKKCAKNYKVKTRIHKEKNSYMLNGFPLEWIEEWEENRFDMQELYKKNYKVQFTHEEWMHRLGTITDLVEFKKKHRKKTLEKISAHLKDSYEDDIYRVKHEMNVVILQNKN